MVWALILAILFGTLIGWIFVKPYNYQGLFQCSDEEDNS
jgi:hypothetical protein